MTDDPSGAQDPDDEGSTQSDPATDRNPADERPGDRRERFERRRESDAEEPEREEVETREDNDGIGDESTTADNESNRPTASARRGGRTPDISVTIEGKYDTVIERLEHPQNRQNKELDTIAGNIERTLLAVLRSGGGIRSEIYNAVDFELNDPWEIRLYLEVLEMHGLIRLQDDRWVPHDSPEQAAESDELD